MTESDQEKIWRLKPKPKILDLSEIINSKTGEPFQKGTESNSLIENLKTKNKELVDNSIEVFVQGIFQFLKTYFPSRIPESAIKDVATRISYKESDLEDALMDYKEIFLNTLIEEKINEIQSKSL